MKVFRQSLRNRLVHWIIAISCLALIITGILQMPVAKRYGLIKLADWCGDYGFTLNLHYAFAAVFTGACIFHLLIHTFEGDFAIVPRRGDVRASVQIMRAIVTGSEEPPSAKYLPEQRLAWAFFLSSFALVIVTGFIKTFKNLEGIDLPDPLLFWLAQIHNLGFVLSLIAFVGHMAAFAIKANRFLLPAMISGWVDATYVKHRHPLWETEEKLRYSDDPETD